MDKTLPEERQVMGDFMDLKLEPLESETGNNQPADFKPKPRETRYLGPERRLGPRRLNADRRAMLRFEPDKEDRRSDTDRRAGGKWNNSYSI